jgi:hypothetical protein
VELVLEFDGEWQRVRVEDEEGQEVFEAGVEGKSVECSLIVEMARLKGSMTVWLEGASRCSSRVRLADGGYPIEDEDGEFRGILTLRARVTDELLE